MEAHYQRERQRKGNRMSRRLPDKVAVVAGGAGRGRLLFLALFTEAVEFHFVAGDAETEALGDFGL